MIDQFKILTVLVICFPTYVEQSHGKIFQDHISDFLSLCKIIRKSNKRLKSQSSLPLRPINNLEFFKMFQGRTICVDNRVTLE